jgi:tryptophan-rich sensory protein
MSLFSSAWAPALVAAPASMAILGVGGWLTEQGPWYKALRKPSWQPPGWAFAPAWTLIYAATTLATVVAWNYAPRLVDELLIIVAFALNGMLNIAWSAIFFKLRRPDWALAENVLLWTSVLLMVLLYYSIIPSAGWLMMPYLVWVAFAGVLNYAVVRINGTSSVQGFLSPAPQR